MKTIIYNDDLLMANKKEISMVPIYICEDQPYFLDKILKTLDEWIFIENYDMKIALATDEPEKIIHAIKENPKRGICFFDIDLKNEDYNGFTLAKKVRELDTRGFIVFVTTHDELALETFTHRIEAVDYIIKDDLENMMKRLQESLKSISQRLITKKEEEGYFTVNLLGESKYIPQKDIILFETSSKKHRIILYSKKRTLEFFGSLNEIETQVGKGFFRVHRSCLVALDKIMKVNYRENEIFLKEELTCSLARNKRKELKERLESGGKENA